MAGKKIEILGQPVPRSLQIVKVTNTALFTLKFEGGGELPNTLKDQHYTSVKLAQTAIDGYMAAK